jgi:hypothetical protein
VFAAVASGFPLATTMHAESAGEAFEQLASFPLEVPREQLMLIDLVVTIGVGYVSNQLRRRVVQVEHVRPLPTGPCIDLLASRKPLRGELDLRLGRAVAALAAWHECSDDEAAAMFARRQRGLDDWAARGIVEPGDVRRAIASQRATS